MRILAVETSCDETAVAVVEDGRRIRANVVGTQLAHQSTGGIVPEVAAREHLRSIDPITDQALRDAGVTLRDIDTVAATVGPGLTGCLLVGANYARGLALALDVPAAGVSTLAALAAGAPGAVPVIDAKRREVFALVHGEDRPGK